MAKGQRKVGQDRDPVVRSLPAACLDEAAAAEFLERHRWPGRASCPHCASSDVYQMKARDGSRNARFLWRCRACNKQFTVRVGTVFEDSRIPLRHWCFAFWQACAGKKGVSAMQIKRQTGLSYKSALFMMHRIRYAMADSIEGPLSGTVEADETYVGGKPKRGQGIKGRGTHKTPVMVMVERDGQAKAFPVADVTAKTLKSALRESVDDEARIMTDKWPAYKGLEKEFKGGHETVDHGKHEYARGEAHVNTGESFFSLLKRGLNGSYHAVSKRHLHRYVSEFEFRWNTRRLDDGDRIVKVIQQSDGRRLYYREPVGSQND